MSKTAADPIAAAEEWRSQRKRTHWKPCWTCSIPQAATVNELKLRGWTTKELQDYLVETHGYAAADVTRNKISHHFDEHHQDRQA